MLRIKKGNGMWSGKMFIARKLVLQLFKDE
jgi:hypothetical protein